MKNTFIVKKYLLIIGIFFILSCGHKTGNKHYQTEEHINTHGIEEGCNCNKKIDITDIEEPESLILATASGNCKTVKYLIKNNVNIDYQDKYKENALALAFRNGHYKCAQILIKNDSDVNNENIYGITPY